MKGAETESDFENGERKRKRMTMTILCEDKTVPIVEKSAACSIVRERDGNWSVDAPNCWLEKAPFLEDEWPTVDGICPGQSEREDR